MCCSTCFEEYVVLSTVDAEAVVIDGVDIPLASPALAEVLKARRLRLSRDDFVTHGYTAGCGGCVALQRGLGNARNHSEICRDRMEAEIEKTLAGRERKQRAVERLDDQLTRELEREDEILQRQPAAGVGHDVKSEGEISQGGDR